VPSRRVLGRDENALAELKGDQPPAADLTAGLHGKIW